MRQKIVIPEFASREEEAEWFDRHKREIEDELVRRIDAGDVKVLRRSRERLSPVTIRMNPEDLRTAREQADRKGVPYQTYIRMLLRESLRRAQPRGRPKAVASGSRSRGLGR
ncbi:MAG: CopG family antitoxin [Terriglobia bacterium]